jgi:acetoin utilization deacetylase AcuC-like enzyme
MNKTISLAHQMDKFARIAHALTHTCKATHPESSLPRPLVRDESHFFRPLDFQNVLSKDWLSSVIDSVFVERFLNGQLSDEECRRIGFREQTSRPELIERTVLEVAGTVLTCQLARHYGIAANVAGGTHHAHPTGGAGYTILNDLAVAAHVLTSTGLAQRVLVIDCDVHQGDGTAQFGATKPLKDKLFTLSLHCASNYPHPKAHSTMDVGLPDGMRDDEYMQVLEESMTRAIEQVEPDFCIYDAGVDIYDKDTLGRLKVSEAGIRRRDRYVLDRCVTEGIPVAAVVGGGYDKDVHALARRHAIVHEECAFVWRKHQLWKGHS